MYKQVRTKIKHTTFKARTNLDGNIISYRISPNKGYMLHEITLDESDIETGETKLGFTESYVTAGAEYDFEKNERQIYAKEAEV